MSADLVEVTQADREAAADLLTAQLGSSADRHAGPDRARSGARDDKLMVQAFARHRLATEASCEARVAEAADVFERVTRLADTLASDVPITASARQHINAAYTALAAIRSGAGT